MRKKDYAWNPSIGTCECDDDCEIGKYLKTYTCIKIPFDNLLITFAGIVNTGKVVSVDSYDKKRAQQIIDCISLLY